MKVSRYQHVSLHRWQVPAVQHPWHSGTVQFPIRQTSGDTLINPLPHNTAFWRTKDRIAVEKIVRKGEIACYKQLLIFLRMFSTLYGTYFSFQMHFKMSSAICFNLDQSKILSSGNGLTLSLLMTTQESFVDSVDLDQTAQNVKFDLWSTLSTFYILDYSYTVSSSYNGIVFFSQWKKKLYIR